MIQKNVNNIILAYNASNVDNAKYITITDKAYKVVLMILPMYFR